MPLLRHWVKRAQIIRRQYVAFNLQDIHWKFDMELRPGDLLCLTLSPTKDISSLFLSLIQSISSLSLNFDSSRLTVGYIDAFGALTEDDLQHSDVHEVVHIDDPTDITKVRVELESDVIVVDCLDGLGWSCDCPADACKIAQSVESWIAEWKRSGKIVILGSVANSRLPLPRHHKKIFV